MLSVAQLDERIERCLAILADNPHSQVFAALADGYRKRGELGRAFSVCKGGLKHHPDYAPAHIVMAKLFLHQNMYDEAMQSLQKAVAIDGKTFVSEQLEAEILIGEHEFQGAREILDRLRSADPSNPALRDIENQLREAMTPPLGSFAVSRGADMTPHPSHAGQRPQTAQDPITVDWPEWATDLTSQPNVVTAFAVSLTGSATTPFSIVAESGQSQDGGVTRVWAAMFAAVDAETRAKTNSAIEELRVEWDGGFVWCRRHKGFVIGFAGEKGVMFGAIRQQAIDSAGHVRLTESPE